MSDKFKVLLISLGNTFVTTFILTIAASLSVVGTVEWTSAFWIGIALTGARAGLAEVVKSFTPQRLGGRK